MDLPLPSSRLSDLIGAVYDCAVEPGLWPAALDAIRAEMRFATAALSSHALPSGRLLLDVTSGYDPAWAARIHEYDREVIAMWGGPTVASSFPIAEPAILSQVNPRAFEPPVNRYLVEWGRPQGLIDSMAVVVARDGASVGSVGFGRHGAEGPIGEAEVAVARLLAPHIQRSIAISRLLDLTAAATAFATIIDRLVMPMILVARDRHVLHVNDAASELLREGVALALYGSRLTSPEPTTARRLSRMINRCVQGEAALMQDASGFPVRDRDGHVCAVHVLPLGRGATRPTLAPPAIAAVLVTRPATRPDGVTDAVAALFGLMPAETRVFRLIASGSAPSEAAVTLGVAPSTLHTHLLRVFGKVGVHRQADLVRLAVSLASPLMD